MYSQPMATKQCFFVTSEYLRKRFEQSPSCMQANCLKGKTLEEAACWWAYKGVKMVIPLDTWQDHLVHHMGDKYLNERTWACLPKATDYFARAAIFVKQSDGVFPKPPPHERPDCYSKRFVSNEMIGTNMSSEWYCSRSKHE